MDASRIVRKHLRVLMNEMTRWRGEVAAAPAPSWGASSSFQDPDLGAIIRSLAANFRLIATITVLGAIAAFFILRAMPPQFTASTLIMLDSRNTLLDETESVFAGMPVADTYIESELELVRSDAIVHRVIEKEGLLDDPEFTRDEIPAGISMMAEKRAAADEAGKQEAEEILASVKLLQVAKEVRKRLDVERRGLSQGIVISFRSKSQVKARDIANAFAETYVNDQLDAKLDASQKATDWLRAELTQLAEETQKAEAAVEAYRAKNTLVGEGEEGVSNQQLRQLSAELTQAKARESEAQALVSQLQRLRAEGKSPILLSEIGDKPTILELRQKLNQSDSEMKELASRYNAEKWESIPPYQEARSRRDALQGALNDEVARAVDEIETRLASARSVTSSLEAQMRRMRDDNAEVNTASIGLNELEREAEGKRKRYETLLAEYNETNNMAASQTPHARIVSPAALPLKPSAPRKKAAFAAAVFFSAAFGVFIALMREFSRRSVRTPEELHAATMVRPIGVIPAVGTRKREIAAAMNAVVRAPNSAYAEAVRSLRIELSLGGGYDAGEVIVVTAPDSVAGQAATAASLARSIALAERKTLLVDADLRRADILHQLFKRFEGRDFAETLCGGGEWRDAVVTTRNPRLSILAARKGGWSEPVSSAFSARFRHLVETWKQEFETIIINAPPVLTFPETRLIATAADEAILCVEWNRTDRRLIVEALDLLSEIGKEPKTVLTNVAKGSYRRLLGGSAPYYAPPKLRVING